MKPKILITRKIPETGMEMLKKRYDVDCPGPVALDTPDLVERAQDCSAVVSLLSDPIGEEVFSASPKLKIVANYAVGYNNIDVDAARKFNIMVTHTPGVLTNATAEIAFALLISLTRRILTADRFTREKRFVGWDPLLFLGDELQGKTMGIIGMGRIGRDMALKCRAFGMDIVYHNRNPMEKSAQDRIGAVYVGLEDLFKRSDMISIHTPFTPDTHHLLDETAFKKMKKGVYLINTARGEVVSEKALIGALESGRVKGAGFDVYEFEPQIPDALMAMENVVLLPHIGSATIETRNKMAEMVARNVIDALEGRIPENLIPEMKPIIGDGQ